MEINFAEIVGFWSAYFAENKNWRSLVKGIKPKSTSCGPVYQMKLPPGRSNESYAIADMRAVSISVPHYHKEAEIYFVIEGSGLVVVGGEEIEVDEGSVVLTLPKTVHFTLPDENLVLGVVSCPPFQGELLIRETNADLKFDKKQFKRLAASCGFVKARR